MELLEAVQYKLGGEPKQSELELDETKRSDQKLVHKEGNDDRSELITYREL
ncbi:hypothetical protein [Alkalicoccus urumqiensis]|uniref:hypothetical protein n=1 Tax=Alkalicoccus urumqiensis TaxID=1548213 RepID=UPI0015E5B103|nr:hypothetical protein [Alkalicoccus urumqiensis]